MIEPLADDRSPAQTGPVMDAVQRGNLERMVPSTFRADLIMQRQLFRGQEYYVIKDPLALTYYRLHPEEAYLVTLLDGKRALKEVGELFNGRFPNKEMELQELAAFVHQLGLSGLLNINARRFVDFARTKPKMMSNILLVWSKILTKLLFLKVPLVDPHPWLGRLVHRLRFVWTKWFVGGCLAFIAWTIFWLLVNRGAFSQNTISFFSPGNLGLIWVSVILIKTLHEFGHATTCRRFGGEVHEMGVCLICFTPAGYVDASDAWMMRHKRHKMYTTVAGIFTEFVLAAIAAHFWLYLPDGLAKNLAFNAMIVASINTIFFNANPLMKFDGYYLMSDWLEIPNLRSKAIVFCSYHLQRIFLGYRNLLQERVLQDEGNARAFTVYAVLAYAYMMLIIYSLSQVFARFLAPYGLKEFGLLLGLFVEISFVMLPIIKVFADAAQAGQNVVREEPAFRRLSKWGLGLAAVVALLVFWPSHYQVEQQAVAMAAEGEQVGVVVPGRVEEVHVRTGDWVEPGQLLVSLSNPRVEADLESARVALEAAKLRMSALQQENSWDRSSQLPEAATALEGAAIQLERAQADAARLKLRASTAGWVLSSDLEKLQGTYAEPFQRLIRIGDTRRLKLMIPLTESQAQLVAEGSPIRGRWLSSGERIEGAIQVLPHKKAHTDEYLSGMLAMYGGPAPLEYASQSEAQPTFGLFIAEAAVEAEQLKIHEGMRANVRITGQKTTVGRKIWRWFSTLWNLKVKA